MLPHNPGLASSTWSERATGASSAGVNELNDFATRTLQGLVEAESRGAMGGKRSISMFCRMDIGITEAEDGKLQYFVNEVERTHTCSLWTGLGETTRAGWFATSFGPALKTWIDAFHGKGHS